MPDTRPPPGGVTQTKQLRTSPGRFISDVHRGRPTPRGRPHSGKPYRARRLLRPPLDSKPLQEVLPRRPSSIDRLHVRDAVALASACRGSARIVGRAGDDFATKRHILGAIPPNLEPRRRNAARGMARCRRIEIATSELERDAAAGERALRLSVEQAIEIVRLTLGVHARSPCVA